MNIYKVAIIGCGSIGTLKPDHIDHPNSENILTHAHAVDAHSRTELYAVIDINDEKLIKTKAKWQPKLAVRTIEDLMSNGIVSDIVIVAVPTEFHVDIVGNICSQNIMPRLIIVEKPFGLNLHQGNAMTELCHRKNLPIMVDYIRRFAKGYQEIKAKFDAGEFGKAQNCRVLYTRGWRREASHAIDLMNWFFGRCLYKETLQSLPIHDYSQDDPTISAFLKYEGCDNIVFQAHDGRLFGAFELDILFEKCRIRFIDNGLYYETYSIEQEGTWGHKNLNYRLTDVIRKETGLNIALYHLIDNAVHYLDGDGNEKLFCTADDAIEVHKVLENDYL